MACLCARWLPAEVWTTVPCRCVKKAQVSGRVRDLTSSVFVCHDTLSQTSLTDLSVLCLVSFCLVWRVIAGLCHKQDFQSSLRKLFLWKAALVTWQITIWSEVTILFVSGSLSYSVVPPFCKSEYCQVSPHVKLLLHWTLLQIAISPLEQIKKILKWICWPTWWGAPNFGNHCFIVCCLCQGGSCLHPEFFFFMKDVLW